MIILKFFFKLIYLMIIFSVYIVVFPLRLIGKLLFWWLPDGNDSDGDWFFWKKHGHDW